MLAGKCLGCDSSKTVHNGSVKGRAKIKCKEHDFQSVLQDQEELFYVNFKSCRTRHYSRNAIVILKAALINRILTQLGYNDIDVVDGFLSSLRGS